MTLCKLFVWFIIYSFMGWIYESIYCTIKKHRWENRGFLHGPIVPIYGIGALLASVVFSLLPFEALQHANNVQIFLISFFGSIVLEYTTSWALEKLFHAYWWDYSHCFCNIHGRVCLFASTGFGLAGILVVRFLYPFVNSVTQSIHPILIEILALIFMFIFGMDLSLTISALTNFTKNFSRIESEINQQIADAYEKLDSGVTNAIENIIEKSEQLQESNSLRKEMAEEKIAKLREQLTNERLESLFASSSRSQRHTILSIQGFRRGEQANEIRTRMKSLIQERRHNK